jgi:Domain of unknown function (DUF3859)
MKWGFVFALAFIVCFTTSVARAQNVTAIEVTEYGIYTAGKKNPQRNSAGVLPSTHIRHAMTTTTVQAEPGVRFGFIYRVIGKPTGQTVQLRKVVIYPPEGVKSPQSSTPLQSAERQIAVRIGAIEFSGYTFDDNWELVPGPWKLQLWLGDRKLAEKEFTVVAK